MKQGGDIFLWHDPSLLIGGEPSIGKSSPPAHIRESHFHHRVDKRTTVTESFQMIIGRRGPRFPLSAWALLRLFI